MLHENTPMANPDASVSKTKGTVNSGRARTGAFVIAFLRRSNANCAFEFHWKQSLCNKTVRGEAITAYPLITCESKKSSQGLNGGGNGPIQHGLYFLWLKFHTLLGYYVAEILQLTFTKEALGIFEKELSISQCLKNTLQVGKVCFEWAAIYKNVIDEHSCKLVREWFEKLVHGCL